MIMARFQARPPSAHGKRVHELRVKRNVLIGGGCGDLGLVSVAGRWQQGCSGAINTQAVLHGPLQKALSIDRAREMIVQVRAFGHAPQEIR